MSDKIHIGIAVLNEFASVICPVCSPNRLTDRIQAVFDLKHGNR